jgi:hypothetical protein
MGKEENPILESQQCPLLGCNFKTSTSSKVSRWYKQKWYPSAAVHQLPLQAAVAWKLTDARELPQALGN